MAEEMILTERVNAATVAIEKQQKLTVSDAGVKSLANITVPASTDDYLVNWTCDYSQLKGLYIVADQDLTLETNDGSSPANTLNLKADVPYLWHETSYHALFITTDVTKLYLSNAGATAATFSLLSVEDVTP